MSENAVREAELRRRAFGLALSSLRRRGGWNQDDFASAWGVSVPTLKRCEAGASQPTLESLLNLAGVLGVSGAAVVALGEAVAAALVAHYDGPLGGGGRRSPSDSIARFVDVWLDTLRWEPLPSEAGMASWPRLESGDQPVGGGALVGAVSGVRSGDGRSVESRTWEVRVGGDAAMGVAGLIQVPGGAEPGAASGTEGAGGTGADGAQTSTAEAADPPEGGGGRDEGMPVVSTGVHAGNPAQASRGAVTSASANKADDGGELSRTHEGRAADSLLQGLVAGRRRVGARVPSTLESGRIAVSLARLATEAGVTVLPMLYVASRRSGRAAFLTEAAVVLPRMAAASLAGDGLPARVDLGCVGAEHVSEVLTGSAPLGGWRTVVIDGLADAAAIGLGCKDSLGWDHGPAVVLDCSMLEPPSALPRLLGGRPDMVMEVGEAMDLGLLPPLRYRGLPDPVDHMAIPQHFNWPHPGEKGAALSDDARLELLVEGGAFVPGSNCLVHVADGGQAAWVTEWLERRLGRRVERSVGSAEGVKVAGTAAAHAAGSGWTAVPVADRVGRLGREEPPRGRAAGDRTPAVVDSGGGRTWVFQRVARLAPHDRVDELILLSPEFPRRMVRQLVAALGHADSTAGLTVWDLMSADTGGWKRLQALLTWFGVGASDDEAPALVWGEVAAPGTAPPRLRWALPGGGEGTPGVPVPGPAALVPRDG